MLNPFLAVIIPLLSSMLGSLLMGLIYCFLTVSLRANQNVTGLALTTFGIGFGNFFGGSLATITKSETASVALTRLTLCDSSERAAEKVTEADTEGSESSVTLLVRAERNGEEA